MGYSCGVLGGHLLGQTEVCKLHHPVSGDHDVLRLDVAVDDPTAVRVSQGVADLGRDLEGPWNVQLFVKLENLFQVFSVHVLHDEVKDALVFANIIDVDDVSVVELRRGARFLDEAADERGVAGKVLGKDLYCHGPPQVELLCLVDHSHAAFRDLFDDMAAAQDLSYVSIALGSRLGLGLSFYLVSCVRR